MAEQERDGPTERNVNVRFPPHILQRLREIGQAEGRSQNSAVLWAVVQYLQDRGYDLDITHDRGGPNNGGDDNGKPPKASGE